MDDATNTSLQSDEHEIARLIAHAKVAGQPDPFFGKRRWVRYQLGMRLEVTTGSGKPGDKWPVLMHSISGGGFGVWSKKELIKGESIFVRQWSETGSTPWLPAGVTHCTVGLQGYLVGARFENPCPPDQSGELAAPEAEGAGTALGEGTAGIASRSGKYLLVVATAVCLAAGALLMAGTWNPDARLKIWSITALTCAGALAAGVGRLMMVKEARFLEALRVAMHRLAKGVSEPTLSVAPPTKKMSGLHRTFLDLAASCRRREEEERSQRQKLEELTQVKSNILSIVSHDLRTPLTSILLYAQMLTEEINQLAADDQRRFLQIISDECTRLSRLVDDLLEVQRWEAGRVKWDVKSQDLSGAIRSCARVFEAMAKSKSVEFSVECPDSLPPVEADADKISQVLSNLLSNAMKYTPAGGKVLISAEARGQEILFRVSDTGPGIPRDKWDQIFDRFSQICDPNITQIDGVGLGLYIVKRIVECHGGAAWVDSEVGSGSEFCVVLPIRAANLKRVVEGGGAPLAGRVLVCDPDPELSAVIAQTLRGENFEVRVCHSGRRLLAQLDQGEVDVVITDVLLPDMNASEVLHSLEKLGDRMFTLILHTYAGDHTNFSRCGVDVFLRRPVSRENLLRAVQEAMSRRGGGRRTVLLVDGGGADVSRLSKLLTEAGHRAMIVDTLHRAGSRIRETSVDALVVSAAVLGQDWVELHELTVAARGDPRVIVLCDPLRKRERRLAEQRQASVVAYRPGGEEDVLRLLCSDGATTPAEA